MSGPYPVGAGQSRDDTFRLERHLGQGGFAHTYHATVIDPQRRAEWGPEVAIKIPLNKEYEQTLIAELILSSILRESLHGLDPRNIVRYLGHNRYRDDTVMVMEYVRDGSLKDLLAREGALDIDRALGIAEGVLEGLVHIHGASIFHRDIKPANILMDGATPKVADLGIGRMLHAGERARTKVFSVDYTSPEVLGGSGAGFSTDLWGTGVVLYEMLTGHLPFGDERTPHGTIIDRIRHGAPAPVHQLRPEIPKALGELVARALAKEPGERFSGSATEMLSAVRRLRRRQDGGLDRAIAEARGLILQNDQAQAAEVALLKITRDYPDEPRSYQYLGEFYNKCMRSEDAERVFKRGLEADPESAILQWDLALTYMSRRRRRDAIEALERATALGLEPSLQRYANTLRATLKRTDRD